MISSFIIVFREVLEAALIVGIVLSYIKRQNLNSFIVYVWSGTAAGVGASALGAVLFAWLAGGFSGRSEELFEGIVMLAGAVLLTTLILWIIKEENHIKKLESRVEQHTVAHRGVGLFFVIFIAVFREGVETIIFFHSLTITQGGWQWIGAAIGFVCALLLGFLIFIVEKKIRLGLFFKVTNIFLLLFAGGMIAYGIHELQDAGVVPVLIKHIYDINPVVVKEGAYPLFHDEGYIGGILKELIGYNGNPSFLEMTIYIAYIVSIVFVWVSFSKRDQTGAAK